MHKVIEVATLLGVSKVTIYKKLDMLKRDMKPHVHKKRNITYIDSEGLEIIRKSLASQALEGSEEERLEDSAIKKETAIRGLDGQDALREELCQKNRQISELLKRIEVLEQEHMDDLRTMAALLETQTAIKRREIDDKITILNGYKDIIGYNKERIRKIEENAYNLFK